jgi:hypothetical protein
MSIERSFDRAIDRMIERRWDCIYVMIDIHDTILKASYSNKETFEWFPQSKETLRLLSHMRMVKLILWTSTYRKTIDNYLKVFKDEGIKFDFINVNTETTNNDLSCFDEKTYFNVGIDDKFGFDAEHDWGPLYDYLVEAIRLDRIK